MVLAIKRGRPNLEEGHQSSLHEARQGQLSSGMRGGGRQGLRQAGRRSQQPSRQSHGRHNDTPHQQQNVQHVHTGSKRKATTDFEDGPSTQRLRTTEPFMDIEYIKMNFQVPSASQYPTAPKTIFDVRNIVQAFNSLPGNPLDARHETTAGGDRRNPRYRCTLRCNLPGNENLVSIGDGRNKV